VLEAAFVTCARLPDLDEDDRRVVTPLLELGCRVVPAAWDDSTVDWDRFDVSVLRSTWDYTDRRDAFVRWARSVPRLLNPADAVAWNTDKRYLADLEAAGIPIVPTSWISDPVSAELPETGQYVLKPAVGAGSLDAERFVLDDSANNAAARHHVTRLLARGQTVMVQPYVAAIEGAGETGVILIEGAFSHAMGKGSMLGPTSAAEVDGLYKEETIEARRASAAEIELANAALDAALKTLGLDQPLLYARADMVPSADGTPMLMELELTEPSLFLRTTPGSERHFAEAVHARAKRRGRARAPAQRARPQQERVVS
jgi:hypothetical protein